MRRNLVVGNWKMNLKRAEARELAAAIATAIGSPRCDVGIIPPLTALDATRQGLGQAPVFVGAQDVFWMPAGAYTGRISASMLADAKIDYCLVGHSETRGKFGKLDVPESTVPFFGETDETVNLKLKALILEGIRPILCIGETLAEREAGRTDDVIRGQLAGALDGIDDELVTVAYEPVWAIGTGQTCDTPEAQRVCALIHSIVGKSVRVLYGGSVNEKNAADLFAQPDIDGGLVGGASLKADTFAAIVAAA